MSEVRARDTTVREIIIVLSIDEARSIRNLLDVAPHVLQGLALQIGSALQGGDPS